MQAYFAATLAYYLAPSAFCDVVACVRVCEAMLRNDSLPVLDYA